MTMGALKCKWVILVTVIGLPCANTFAQQIDFKFQVYKLDVIIADALQERLIDGGDPALQAIAKMPDFVKQKKASLEAELNFQTQSGQRANKASSKNMLEGNTRFREIDEKWEIVDGLDVEMDASLDPGGRIIDVDMYATFAMSSDQTPEGAKVRQLTSSFSMITGVPFLVSRWQEGEEVLLFVGTATAPSSSTASTQTRQMIYQDVAFYRSAADAKTQRDQIGRITTSSRSGTKSKSQIYVIIVYDTAVAMDSHDLGFKIESDSKTNPSGAIDFSMVLEHTSKTGRSERMPDGTRAPELEIREARPVLQMKDGEVKTVSANILSLGNPVAKPDAWVMTVDFKVREVR